ncbi:hypothetical protein K469DRAFT_706824 [Zopfia rhizophila CBS 207.26]|uniref:Uncharacterized protein n=1 Tax=Zopfia rhizophila CBS 207.26 TaxID=1314779 RepID=A0A6A6E576_9PEZI|nr:hypothetical protein K469DRAFT_706824 [Zopfia rhizophila CBS 207.26]
MSSKLVLIFAFPLFALSFTVPLLEGLMTYDLKSNIVSNKNVGFHSEKCPPITCIGDCLVPPLQNECWLHIVFRAISGPTAAIIVGGTFGMIASALTVHAFRKLYSKEATLKIKHTWMISAVYSTLTYLLLILSVLIYVFVEESKEKDRNWDITQYARTGLFGPFTRESWACNLKKYNREIQMELGWIGLPCKQAKAARWMLLPMLICAAAQLATCTLFYKDRIVDIEKSRKQASRRDTTTTLVDDCA